MGKYFKEIIIGILLIIVIVFLIIIALYDYSPAKKNYSQVQSYTRTSEVQNVLKEISSSSIESAKLESVITSYSITSNDLTHSPYEEAYLKERANPFAKVKKEEIEDTTGSNDNTGDSGNTTSGNSSSNSSAGLFKNTGSTK